MGLSMLVVAPSLGLWDFNRVGSTTVETIIGL